ncbi:hypothetical protein B9Z55_018393 [Caenorhabditis nigoni]|uniref:G-protein coupled receptors family 1 profile domain-containing protein n=1 Tax=Caenorhabditis nigoni TaxID=1611254 RepID=A0A2G5TDP2_9PELO|nr:hypothetical protein B9Z55_018393 [Caenorhabditis nigoni]
MCVWRNSSYELDSFAPSILHKLAVVELPVHLLAAYVIIFKTPPTMKSVKGMMLLMHLCGAYLDLFISALSNQYFMFPAAAGYTQGFYTYLGVPIRWQGYMYVSGLCLAGVSILGFFENRFTAVVRGKKASLLHEKWRLFYIVGNYIFAVVFIFPITFTAPEQSYGKAYVREILPCVPNEIIEHPQFFVYAIDVTLLTCIISFASVVITLQCIYFFSRTLIYLSSRKAKSQRTYKLQLQFFIALSIQIIIPICAIIAPVGYIAFACATSYFDQALNNIFVNVIAFHGLISSVVMLGVHKPYRQAVLGMIKCAYLDKKLMGSSAHVEGTTAIVLSSKRPSIHPQVYIGPGHNYLPVD